MRISVEDAKRRLVKLVRRAQTGEEVVLTREGHASVRLVPVQTRRDRDARRALMEAVRASASAKATAGPDAARSQDFLYTNDWVMR